MGSTMEPALRFPAPLLRGIVLLALCGLTACSTVKVRTDTVSTTREALRSADLLRSSHGPLAAFADNGRRLLRDARLLERHAPAAAAAHYLQSAVEAHRQLASGPAAPGSDEERCLVDLHNRSLARFAELWVAAGSKDRRLSCEGTELEIRLAKDSAFSPGYFDRVIATASLKEKGVERQAREGLGATLVGIREPRPERLEEMRFYPLKGLHVPATLTIEETTTSADGLVRVDLALRNPLRERTVAAGRRTFPLAADYSAPMAVILDHQSEASLGLKGFFKAATRAEVAGIYLTEPYDPKRTPVLLIHGLISVPMIWRDLIPHMLSDAELAERYQFMVFAYPSGYPIVESAALLRDRLAELRAHLDPDGSDPLSRNMVVAGHSMGGILTHTLVADIGDRLWEQFDLTTSFEQLQIDPARKERLRHILFFDPDPATSRAIFFSAPHRGATMAEKSLAGLLSRAAKLPTDLLVTTSLLLDPHVMTNPEMRALQKGTYTSAQSLRPGAPMIAALDASPYRSGVVYHSIIGDRGRGDTPNSSDGVVEYWSSHQEGAASELIVPSDHGSYKDPAAVEEMKRILYEHAGLRR